MLGRALATRERHAIDLRLRHLYESRRAIDFRDAGKIEHREARTRVWLEKLDGNLRSEALVLLPAADLRRVDDHLAAGDLAFARILPVRAERGVRGLRGRGFRCRIRCTIAADERQHRESETQCKRA